MAIIAPGSRLPSLKASYQDRRPHLVILQDAGADGTGLSGFPMASAALRWNYATIIRLADPTAEQYAAALDFVGRFQRVVLVETTGQRINEWAEAAKAEALPREARIAVIRPGVPVDLTLPRKRLAKR